MLVSTNTSSFEDAALHSFHSHTKDVAIDTRHLLEATTLSPAQYSTTIDTLRTALVANQHTSGRESHRAVGERAHGARPENYVFSAAKDDPISTTYTTFLQCGVYNRPFDAEQLHNVNLRWDALRPLREEIVQRLHQDDVIAILPFVAERRTAHRNVLYALDTVGHNSVLAVSAVSDQESELNVTRVLAETESKLVSQEEILRCFDWERIGKACAIPTRFENGVALPPVGGKGLTMLAGVAVAALKNRLDGRYVFFSDTDFISPWEYDSFTHLAIPLAIESDFSPRLIKTAKTGPGRNNEAWTREANLIASDPLQTELTRGVALLCQQFIWPLSGNLAIRGEDLYDMHFASGAGIETQINAYYAGRQLESGACEVAQVCNPNPLVEDGESRPVRESAMIGRCQMWLRSVLTSIGDCGEPLHRWGLAEIERFNKAFGGAQHWGAFQDASHAPQTPSKITLDYMIPSLYLCDSIGAVDWARMATLLARQSGQG